MWCFCRAAQDCRHKRAAGLGGGTSPHPLQGLTVCTPPADYPSGAAFKSDVPDRVFQHEEATDEATPARRKALVGAPIAVLAGRGLSAGAVSTIAQAAHAERPMSQPTKCTSESYLPLARLPN